MEGFFNAVIIFAVVVFCARFSSSSVPLVNRTTLTTSKVLGTFLPKPTSWNRRIYVEPVAEFSSTPYELLRVSPVPQRRSNLQDLFDWDYWCQIQPTTGNCSASGRKGGPMTENYYYHAQEDSCKSFVYSGCDGNKNNFPSEVECERHCKGSNYMTLKYTRKNTYCHYQQDYGICLLFAKRYYYDATEKECKEFIYGGCGGNQNRFNTYEQCIKTCKNVQLK